MNRPALRAAARTAWRQSRRSPLRSALVIALVGFPIGALTLGSTLVSASISSPVEQVTEAMGTADLLIHLNTTESPDVERLDDALPIGARTVDVKQRSTSVLHNGEYVWPTFIEPAIPYDEEPVAGMNVLLHGRWPRSPGEAAVAPKILRAFDARIRDRVTIDDVTVLITGIAARPTHFGEEVFLATGTMPAGRTDLIFRLVDLPSDVDPGPVAESLQQIGEAELHQAGDRVTAIGEVQSHDGLLASYSYSEGDQAKAISVGFAGAAVALCGTGLIVAAAFVVGLRRQLRALGLIGAVGGEPAHVRAVVLLGGTTLGAVGSVIGIVSGITIAYLVLPHVSELIDTPPGSMEISWPAAFGGVLLGTVAATVAALAPARLAARITTLDALAARTPSPKPAGRLAGKGVIAVAVGAVAVAYGTIAKENGMLAAGLVTMVGGVLISIPLVVTWVGRLASRLPMSMRIAARDTARHGRRTGAATAAATIALMLPVAVSALSLSQEEYQRRQHWIADDHILVSFEVFGPGEVVDPGAPSGFAAEVRETFGGWTVAPRSIALYPAVPEDTKGGESGFGYPASQGPIPSDTRPAYVEGAPEYGPGVVPAFVQARPLYVGGPDLLRALHAEDGIPALRSGRVIAVGKGVTMENIVRLLPISGDPQDGVTELPAVEAGETKFLMEDVPRFVISPETAKRLGLTTVEPRSLIIRSDGAPTDEEVARLREIAGSYSGAWFTTLDDFVSDLGPIRAAATGGAALIALGIVAVIVALAAAEARRDRAILVAVGAGKAARRKVVGASAGLLAGIAAIVAVPAGLAPVGVMQAFREGDYPVVIPWTTMAGVLLVVPLIAAGFSALFSRQPRSSAMLQPIA